MAPTPPPAASAAVTGGAHTVFVYGSLMAEEVVRAILKRVPPAAPAILPNYGDSCFSRAVALLVPPPEILWVWVRRLTSRRWRIAVHRFNIKERIYPAILPVENKKVTGKIIKGVTDDELHVLDAFEDVEYTRTRVEVSLTDSSETLLVDTYVWSDAEDPNLYGEWDFEEWKKLHMKDFLAITFGFMHELEQPESKTRIETYRSFMHQQEQPPSDAKVEG